MAILLVKRQLLCSLNLLCMNSVVMTEVISVIIWGWINKIDLTWNIDSSNVHQDQHFITIWNSHTDIHIVHSAGNCMISELTSVSASRKTHLLYWVRVQQWILVKVMPSSGRPSMNRLGWSSLSIMSTMTTSSNTLLKESLMRHNV